MARHTVVKLEIGDVAAVIDCPGKNGACVKIISKSPNARSLVVEEISTGQRYELGRRQLRKNSRHRLNRPAVSAS